MSNYLSSGPQKQLFPTYETMDLALSISEDSSATLAFTIPIHRIINDETITSPIPLYFTRPEYLSFLKFELSDCSGKYIFSKDNTATSDELDQRNVMVASTRQNDGINTMIRE